MTTEILNDDLMVYAHVDAERDEAVVAYSSEAQAELLQEVYRKVVDAGFVRVEEQWHDADWQRDVVLLKRDA